MYIKPSGVAVLLVQSTASTQIILQGGVLFYTPKRSYIGGSVGALECDL